MKRRCIYCMIFIPILFLATLAGAVSGVNFYERQAGTYREMHKAVLVRSYG